MIEHVIVASDDVMQSNVIVISPTNVAADAAWWMYLIASYSIV